MGKKLDIAKYKLIDARTSKVHLPRVTSLGIFLPSSNVFDPDGLFSTEIFGMVGDKERYTNWAAITLHTTVITPMIYDALLETKYRNILYGKNDFIWNPEKKDFEPTTVGEGKTGIHFFKQHINELEVEDTGSASREVLINLMKAHKGKYLVSEVFVEPAGYREYTQDETGMGNEGEINDFYRKILINTNLLPKGIPTTAAQDKTVANIQTLVHNLYLFALGVLSGKEGAIRAKFTSRAIHNATRNILISQHDSDVSSADDPNILELDEVKLSLLTAAKGMLPKVAPLMMANPIISRIVGNAGDLITVTDTSTLKQREATEVERKLLIKLFGDYDKVIKFIDKYKIENSRMKPIKVGNAYLGMCYDNPKDPNVYYTQVLADLPEGYKKDKLRPINATDILLTSIWEATSEVMTTNTRFPIDNPSSLQINKLHIKVTDDDRPVTVHMPDNTTIDIHRFPIDTETVNGIATHANGWAGHSADSDGDGLKTHILMTDQAVKQGIEILNSPKYYLEVTGELRFSSSNNIADAVFAVL